MMRAQRLEARRVLACLLAVCFALPLAAQTTPDGTWTGELERDGSTLGVELTFARDASGYLGTLSSTQLRLVGAPLSAVEYAAPRLSWEVAVDDTPSTFEGSIGEDTLSGTFRDGSASGRFTLTRGSSADPPARESAVSFTNGGVTLSGTLVAPAGAGPFAGVVFLHDAGAEGRWVSRYLAQELARHGIASLIYDQRGVGRSGGDWRTARLDDLVGDATAAVETLRARSDVAPDRVGIHGHGQGATIAPRVASADPRVAFVVASAASSDPSSDWRLVTVPALLSYGEEDERVPARSSAQRIADAYLGARGPRLDVLFFPLADHDYRWRPDNGGKFAWPRNVPDYPERVIDWVVEVSRPCACKGTTP